MEHRLRKRLPRAIKVMLYHNRLPIICCNTRDIGKDGMFVEAGSLSCQKDSVVDIEFEGISKYGGRWYRLSAIVAHFSKDGLGLYFGEDKSKALQAWHHLLQSDASQLFSNELVNDDPEWGFVPT